MAKKTGTIFETGVRTVQLYNGPRGEIGAQGQPGPQGAPGDSFHVRGIWNSGTTYCPLDAVSYRSRLMDGVNSLYIQRDTTPCSPSTLPPNLDPTRWEEFGAYQYDNAFGGIWEVYQPNHGFLYAGTPVSFSPSAGVYVSADAQNADELGIAIVREVIDQDRVILQSSGEVPFIDDRVIYPTGSAWVQGDIYYVSAVPGRLEQSPPTIPGSYSNPILMATDSPSPGAQSGVALPWTPQAAGPTPYRMVVGFDRLHYIATAGQTVFTGPDRDGVDLNLLPTDLVEVFIDGLNQDETTYTVTPPDTVTLGTGATVGQLVEIWKMADTSSIILPSTVGKLDDITPLFDGSRTVFPLTVSGIPVNLTGATNFMFHLDTFVQEALLDYDIVPDPGDPTHAAVEWRGAPPIGTRFYGLTYEPYYAPSGVAANSFIGLTDTPAFYSGGAGRYLKVNQAEDGILFELPTFLEATDTPIGYAGNAGWLLRVNAAEDAVEFFEGAFVAFPDTPSSYVGAAGQHLRVNALEDGVEFFDPTFIEAVDTPADYTGAALWALRVNAAEDAVEFYRETFLSLQDTPAAMGNPGQLVAVDPGGTGLVFIDPPAGTFLALTDTPSTFEPGRALVADATGTFLEWIDVPDGNFIGKLDTPTDFSGAAGQRLVVNQAEDAVIFEPIPDADFLALTDTPAGYGGAGGFLLAVNQAEDAVEYVDPSALTVNLTITAGDAFPATPVVNSLHYRTVSPVGLYIYYDDGNTQQWVKV